MLNDRYGIEYRWENNDHDPTIVRLQGPIQCYEGQAKEGKQKINNDSNNNNNNATVFFLWVVIKTGIAYKVVDGITNTQRWPKHITMTATVTNGDSPVSSSAAVLPLTQPFSALSIRRSDHCSNDKIYLAT